MVSGSDLEGFLKSLRSVTHSLPPEMKRRLHDIEKTYFAKYGLEGGYQRMNNRTVAQILTEYEEADVKPIVSGESDGVRWNLYPPAGSAEGGRDG
jgi:hypothetical protein